MIPRLGDWTWARRPDGVVMTCGRPDLAATVRYVENQRPLERLGDLIERHTRSALSQRRVSVVGQPRRLITNEGEYGALIELISGDRCWFLGFVFGDDSYAYLEADAALVHADKLRSVVEDLLQRDLQQHGARLRRYLFSPPPWQGLMLGRLTAHFVPADYPRRDCRISVFPAYPLNGGDALEVDLQRTIGEHLLAPRNGPPNGFVLQGAVTPLALSVPSGLHGYRAQLRGAWHGRQVVRDIAVLRDAQYAYALELETSPDRIAEAMPLFDRVVQSVEPIPNVARHAPPSAAFTYWAE